MSWARFDDHFDDDPDCDVVGDGGIALFLCSITWAARNNTDGHIPAARARKLPGYSPETVRLLISVNWWVEVTDGYQIRSYLKYNKSRAQIEAEHEAKVNAGRNGGQRSGEARRGERPVLTPAEAGALPFDKGATQPTDEVDNEASALANDEASALARPQAKTKPVSRVPSPESYSPKPTPNPPLTPPPNEPPPGEDVCVLLERFAFLEDGQRVARMAHIHGVSTVFWQARVVELRMASVDDPRVRSPIDLLADRLEKHLPLPHQVKAERDAEAEAEKAAQQERDQAEHALLETMRRERAAAVSAAWGRLSDEEKQDVLLAATERYAQQSQFNRDRLKKNHGNLPEKDFAAMRGPLLIEHGHLQEASP